MFRKYFQAVLLFMLLTIIPSFNVSAATTSVSSEQALLEALNNESVTNIVLANDIDTTDKINITRDVVIDGANHTLKYVGAANVNEWHGIYILQVYKCSATIKDIKLTGGNAALLVNGGTVTLEGKIDVSGNTFGGIELGQGAGVTETPHLDLDQTADLVNSTESEDKPTLWVPSDTKEAIIEHAGVMQTLKAGQELTNSEVSALFKAQESPATQDNILLPSLLGIIGTLGLAISTKKVVTLN